MWKGLLSCSLWIAVGCSVWAQNAALTNAILYLEDNDPVKARTEIDAAVSNEKTSGSAKAWYYRGMIYNRLNSDHLAPAEKGLLDTAAASFNKAKSLDKANGQFIQMSDIRLNEIWVNATNEGVKKYQESDFSGAIKSFQLAHRANPKDTTALLYGSYAAIAKKDTKQAYAFTEDLKKIGYLKSHVYKTAADYYEEIEQPAKEEAELKEGLVKNPGDATLLQGLANYYITTDKNEQAVQILSELEKNNPNDPLVLINIAVQYQKFNQPDKAEAYYQKVLAKDPNNFIALFNLASLYVDKSRSKLNTYNSLTAEQFKKQGPALKSELSANYTKALEYCKRALPLADSSDDKDKLNTMIADLETALKGLNK